MALDAVSPPLSRSALPATPDSIVLDIGTGSGLLAMMAARAGAKHVYASSLVCFPPVDSTPFFFSIGSLKTMDLPENV
jgi:hypothetical protein